MNIAELFVSLDIKGSKKVEDALTGAKRGLNDTASSALATKAALVGVLYALERMFAASSQRGTDLKNFNTLVGTSAQTLQEYEYAARQVGVSNQELDGTFKALQGSMTKTLMGEGAPKGLARVSQILEQSGLGAIDANDLKKFAEQPELLVQKLQQYAQKETNKGLKNEVLKSFGISDGMVAALNRNAFRPEVFKQAPTYSDKEINNLDKARTAWSNVETAIEMSIGKFNAKHGVELSENVGKIVAEVLKLAEAFTTLADKLKIFDKFGIVVQGWTALLKGLTSSVNDPSGAMKDIWDTMNAPLDANGNPGQQPQGRTLTAKDLKKLKPEELEQVKNLTNKGMSNEDIIKIMNLQVDQPAIRMAPPISPSAAARPSSAPVPTKPVSGTPVGNVNVNQTLNFNHDGKNAKETSDSVKKAVKDAYKSNPAQAQGS